MEHARKLVLVPHENIERLQSILTSGVNNNRTASLIKSVQTPDNVMTRLDAEMNNILNSSTCESEREKWAQYRTVLQPYLHFKGVNNFDKLKKEKDNKDDQRRHNNDDKDNEEIRENEKVEKEDRIDASIIESVSKSWRLKAAHVLRRLRVSSNIEWAANGTVTIGGVRIRDANMIDLMNDAMRKRKGSPLAGHTQFAIALRESVIAREYIVNPRVEEHNGLYAPYTEQFHTYITW